MSNLAVDANKNVVLIGMPAVGKTTLGKQLSIVLDKRFVDTDVLIEAATQESLQKTLDRAGYLALRNIEQDVIVRSSFKNCVVATGGSAVYGEQAMQVLCSDAVTIYLSIDPDILLPRISNWQSRGIARSAEQSFEQLYAERHPLYQLYADIEIDCSALTIEQAVAQLTEKIRQFAIST